MPKYHESGLLGLRLVGSGDFIRLELPIGTDRSEKASTIQAYPLALRAVLCGILFMFERVNRLRLGDYAAVGPSLIAM